MNWHIMNLKRELFVSLILSLAQNSQFRHLHAVIIVVSYINTKLRSDRNKEFSMREKGKGQRVDIAEKYRLKR